jgi:hypothetical protein
MIKVFLSSTSRDLGPYRQKAIEICRRFDFEPIAMEYFEAMSVGATQGSLRKVDESELYVGIFAHRYGYVEDGYQKAVTELEFDRAYEQNIDRLCFIVDPTYPWPPEAIDYENRDKLEALKRRIDKYHIRAQFTTVDDFGAKLAQTLIAWQKERGKSIHQNTQTKPQRVILAPPRPGLLIGRDDDLEKIKARLRKGRSSGQVTIVRGWPGVGKTTLITTLAHDEGLENDFPDGVLWAGMGQEPKLFAEFKQWAAAFGRDNIGITLEEAVGNLKRLLANKRILFIADDIWNPEDTVYFREIAGPNSALLITTREDQVARSLADSRENDIIHLKQLTNEQSLELLERLAPKVVERHPDAVRKLVEDLEGLPLAIRVVGRLLDNEARLRTNIEDLIADLRQGKAMMEAKAPSDRGVDPDTKHFYTVDALMRQSTDRLEPDLRLKFATLGTFAPKPATFDVGAMQFIWEVNDAMPDVRALTDRGLLEPLPTIGRYQMHAILVMHAKNLLKDEAALTAPVKSHAKRIIEAQDSVPITGQVRSEAKHTNQLVTAETPEEYRRIYMNPLRMKLKTLKRRSSKGEDVDAEIQDISAEIRRLGGNPDEV